MFELVKAIVEGWTTSLFVVAANELVQVRGRARPLSTGATRDRLLACGSLHGCGEVIVERRGWWHGDIASLLILVLHLSTAHLLLELPLKEIDFELHLFLRLFAFRLLLRPQIALLLELLFVLALQTANLILLRTDDFPKSLLLF